MPEVGSETDTWFWRLVRFRTGAVATLVQFVVVRLEFCCNAKLSEGMVQESTALPPEGARLKDGVGVVCKVQILPLLLFCVGVSGPVVATNWFPSAGMASAPQLRAGLPVEVQVTPELDEK